jgi:membrane-associated protein
METLVDLFLHLDRHLAAFVATYGVWIYGLLFLIIFCETGLVVTPFLPGDSLLFAAGALAATGALDLKIVLALLVVAAISGDTLNYFVGRAAGPRIFRAEDASTFWHRVLNRDHLDRAHEFFDRYGWLAIVTGRFMPIVRTFVPFVAGAGTMPYPRFTACIVAGALIWVGSCVIAGFLFGNVPFVKNHFSLVVIGIVAVSLLPVIIGALRHRGRAGA